MYRLGVLHLGNVAVGGIERNPQLSYNLIKDAVKHGCEAAVFHRTIRDGSAATDDYEMQRAGASSHEDFGASYMMGSMCYEGRCGAAQDFHAAADWFSRAADRGHCGAAHYLGLMYRRGHGRERNLIQDRLCFEAAVEQGYAPS